MFKKNFKHWNDVANNMTRKLSVNGYLNTLRFIVSIVLLFMFLLHLWIKFLRTHIECLDNKKKKKKKK